MDCFASLKRKIPLRPLRMDVIKSYNNIRNDSNEGKKHGSYDRYLSKIKNTVSCPLVNIT